MITISANPTTEGDADLLMTPEWARWFAAWLRANSRHALDVPAFNALQAMAALFEEEAKNAEETRP